jgi:pyruvate,water dikinase
MSESQPLVSWFQDCNKDSVPLVGGKCASLGEMINAGIRVPPGFAVTTEAYRHFLRDKKTQGEIALAMEGLDHQDMEALDKASATVRGIIEATSFSQELEDQVSEYYRLLSRHCGLPATPVAVRSSATAEDLPGASFAGQQDTFLWVRGVDDMLDKVRRCFSSLFTARAIAYRVKMGFDHSLVDISVGVQKMANSFTAGVMFTLNPANGDRSQITIDSNYGFGESVVSGEVTPDHFRVDKITLDILERTVSKKEIYYTLEPAEHRSKCMKLPETRQELQSLIDEDIIELAKMGKAIEKHYGCPQDIEWAVDKDMPTVGNVFILQSRPETVWSSKECKPVTEPGKKTAMDHILSNLLAGKKLD